MLINRRVDYALRFLVCLSKKKGLVSIAELSACIKVPKPFLAKIIQILSKHKIVRSIKGNNGGVALLDKQLNVWQVIKILDPKLAINKCMHEEFACFFKKKCPIHLALKKIEKDLICQLKQLVISKME